MLDSSSSALCKSYFLDALIRVRRDMPRVQSTGDELAEIHGKTFEASQAVLALHLCTFGSFCRR
eukprot:5495929-Pleurochrysis_carterae.AAC.2